LAVELSKTTESLDISAYLARAAGEGQAEGQGEFTVAHHQAARKLARFSLPRSTAWVTKLVQVAVRWQARSVEVFTGVGESRFQLNLDTIPSEEAIISAIVAGGMDRGQPLHGLALALRAVVEQAGLSFLLVVDDGQTKPRPIYAGRHFNRMSEKARLSRRFHPCSGLHLTIHHGPTGPELAEDLIGSLNGSLRILAELTEYCFASPVPLLRGRTFGGELIAVEGLLESSRLGLPRPNRLLLLKGLRELTLSPASLPLPADFEDKRPTLLAHPNRVRRSYDGARTAQSVLVVGAVVRGWREGKTRRRSHLLWLNDGVVVQEESLNSLPTELLQMTVLANASGLATDLTGFALLDNEEYRARREEVLRAAGDGLLDLKVNSGLYEQDQDEHSHRDRETASREGIRLRAERWKSFSASGWTALLNPLLALPAIGEALWEGARERYLDLGLLRQREEFLNALEDDRSRLVQTLTGAAPPPPPQRRVEFVFRRG
jgi:hypothetical protein